MNQIIEQFNLFCEAAAVINWMYHTRAILASLVGMYWTNTGQQASDCSRVPNFGQNTYHSKGTNNKIMGNFHISCQLHDVCLLNDSTGKANAVIVLHARKNTQKKSDIFKSATSISPIILKNRLETKETRETISNNALHKTAFGPCFVGPILPVLSEGWRLVDDACACLWMVRWSNESNGPGVAIKWMNLCGNIAICQDLPGSFQGLDKNKQNASKKNWHLSLPKISS